MLKILRLGVLIFLLPILFKTECMAAGYLDNLREAVSQIELGSYDRAAEFIQKGLAQNDGDPLAHTALGVVFLHTAHYPEAEHEFREALKAQPEDWRLYYALGMVDIAEGHPADSQACFESARKFPGSEEELAALDAYMSYLSGGKEPPVGRHPEDLLIARETWAIWAYKSGHYPDASATLAEILRIPAPLGFQEFRAPLVTFSATHPFAFPKGKLTWRRPEIHGVHTISGKIMLRAETSKIPGATIVTFSVDGDVVGMTNCAPFQFEWNTAYFTNGVHEVKIEARNDLGTVLSTKKLKVLLSNAQSKKVIAMAGPAVEELQGRLWNCVKPTDSRELAHYYLGKMYLKAGDQRSAFKQFQYAIAYNHDLLDARRLLSEARGSRFEYHEIYRGPQGHKRIALTFDDGPNERTEEMLQVLNKLHVPATFFVVGFRAEAQSELIKSMAASGHEIENHTYTHPRLPNLTIDQAESELAKGEAVVLALTDKPSLYFRPPGGHSDTSTRTAAARLGLTSIFWTIVCSGYEGARYEQLADHVINNASDGAIVLMHNGEPATTSALPRIVNTLRAKGYHFVTLSELLSNR